MKIALILNDDFSMWHFRKGLIVSLINRGCDVYVMAPHGPYVEKIKGLGAKYIVIPIERFLSPLKDFLLFLRLYIIFRREKFDLVHTMTIKPNIYGSIAAKLAGIKRVVGLISGLGFMFSDTLSLKFRIFKPIVHKMYKIGLKFSDMVWFQNPDDMLYFIENGLLQKDKAVLIKSGGINTEEYSVYSVDKDYIERLRNELNIKNTDIVVTMITARMIWAKGVKEFIEVSEKLKDKYSNVKFLLIGPIEEDSADAVPEKYLQKKESENLKILITFRTDIKELITLSDIVVLPSYYKEGIPRVLLEAMSLGKPIVTTYNPGCKEVVENNKNGFLVPVKDSKFLAKAIEELIVNDKKREEFGKYSRLKAENEFDEKLVIEKIFKELYQFN